MPINLEIKLELDSFRDQLSIIKMLGAKKIEVLNQKDIYYSSPIGLLKLRNENGNNTLIFYNRQEKRKNRWSEFQLLKFDKDNPSDFLRNIFKVEVIVEKRRQLFIYNNSRIHFDNVKGLGKFLELESLVVNRKADAEKRFKFLITQLKLDPSKQIRKSYRDLIMEKKNQK